MKILRPYQLEALDKLRSRLRETDAPLLINASVGAGKSLIIAELLLVIERAGWRALCLTMNSTLISQNARAYEGQGGHAGIFCAALKSKDTDPPIIFASPLSVRQDIKKNGLLSKIHFNLIVVDEAHNINISDKASSYMRIFHHYSLQAQAESYKLRFVGLTGTPYRGKGFSIVGEHQFFKDEVCNISAPWLIDQGYLVQPKWGYYENDMQYDFKDLQVNQMGKFNGQALEHAVSKEPRLTQKIMTQVKDIVSKRKGAFIFASTIKHCHECAQHLPAHQTGVITGDTSDTERERLINQAHAGFIKYLINVNVLSTGVDIPVFDTVVFVRPTESLVLYTQCLGRGLRIHPGKEDCLILDYAGNLDRHGDIDNPLINKALSMIWDGNDDYCIPCLTCSTPNKVTARRCIGMKDNKRCDNYFEWKNCHKCNAINDLVARHCRVCDAELIDPNASLDELAAAKVKLEFKIARVTHSVTTLNGHPRWLTSYSRYGEIPMADQYKRIQESFVISSEKAARYFYGSFAKDMINIPFIGVDKVQDIKFLNGVIQNKKVRNPTRVECVETSKGLKVVKRYFDDDVIIEHNKKLTLIDYELRWLKAAYKLEVWLYGKDEDGVIYKTNTPFSLKSGSSKSKFIRFFVASWVDATSFDDDALKKLEKNMHFPLFFEIDYKRKLVKGSKIKAPDLHGENNQKIYRMNHQNREQEITFKIIDNYLDGFVSTIKVIKGYAIVDNEPCVMRVYGRIHPDDLLNIGGGIYTHFVTTPYPRKSYEIDYWIDKDGVKTRPKLYL